MDNSPTTVEPKTGLQTRAIRLALATLLVGAGTPMAPAATFHSTIELDGDISDFFDPTGQPLPGVRTQWDTNLCSPAIPGLPEDRSRGLYDESDSACGNCDQLPHPSGFNLRRIMAAYNPEIHAGTLYVGLDLPGGTDSAANPTFRNDDYGLAVARGQVLPFDADGNGEPDAIGRTLDGQPISHCPTDGYADVWSCQGASVGCSDDPRTDIPGGVEFYEATVTFGGAQRVSVIFLQSRTTPQGSADLVVLSLLPFGALVSSSTRTSGAPLGFDVEFALTNIHAAVPNPDHRLDCTITVRAGSFADTTRVDSISLGCPPVLLQPSWPAGQVLRLRSGQRLQALLANPTSQTIFQWFRDGQAIEGAVSHSLPVTEPGLYTVTISNPAGSVTATIAEVEGPLTLTCQRLQTDSDPRFLLHGNTKLGVQIQASTNWIHWEPIWTNPNPTGPFNFPCSPSDPCPSRYFRAVPWPDAP